MLICLEEVIKDLIYERGHGPLLSELHPIESLYVLIADYWLVHGWFSFVRGDSSLSSEPSYLPFGEAEVLVV